MSERQTTSACPHPEAVGARWGDPISEERQGELQRYLDRWEAETDHGRRIGPFDKQGDEEWATGVSLSGADVYWLAEQVREPYTDEIPEMNILVPNLHLEGAALGATHLEGADIGGAHLEETYLVLAHMDGAMLADAHLERAALRATKLTGASLNSAHLEEAEFRGAHLEGAGLVGADLRGADLSEAWFDSKTHLGSAVIENSTAFADIHWGGVGTVDLTQIDWTSVSRLGFEYGLRRTTSTVNVLASVREYRQVAAQLRAGGVNEIADRFLYRAQVCQRRVLLRRFRILQYLGSLFLDLISGYGYRPVRSLIAYVLVILGFAATYFALGAANGQPLLWNEAIVISMTAFHGRGFFQTAFQPGDLQAAVAAVEAFIGLLIEIVLIATFTQRFFAR